jgi:hypothetical protein
MIGVILEFKPLLYYSKFSAAYFEKDFLKVVFYINTGSGVTNINMLGSTMLYRIF